MRKAVILIIFVLALICGAISGQSAPSPIAYVTPPPAGKLPWPQHDPAFTRQQYEDMMDSLFLINNFGQYQAGNTRSSMRYLHDGLDVVLANGTKIFAVASGRVRAIFGGNEYNRTLVIEDADHPKKAWSYTHINNFQVKEGDEVVQGTYLGDIHFHGVPHIHLARVHRADRSKPWSDFRNLAAMQPDAYFDYTDTEPPIFDHCFCYFRNMNGKRFPQGDTVVLSGDVDIVVGLRDPGECAHSRTNLVIPGYGDRLAVSRIEYEIAGNGQTFAYRSFDMSKLIVIPFSEQVKTMYRFHMDIRPEGPGIWDKFYSYYVITNTDASGRLKSRAAWRTKERRNGRRIFPDGEYVLTVRAWDFKGNMAEKSEKVLVRNGD